MKRVSFLVVLMGLFLLASTASTDFLGVKKSTETVSFFLNDPLDSTGVARKPDSAHVLTYADNASAATFTATSTTYPFSDISIDTLKIYGDTIYVFSDAIADIDGAGGNFQLAIEVKLFCNTLPTPTHATVQITADSLNVLATINDSLEAYDGWVATSAKQTLVIDTVNAVLDTLQSQDGWVGTSAKQTLVIDTVNAILDTLQEWDDEIGLVTAMRDTINAIIDTTQNQDGWIAQQAGITAITDTANAILDTLQLWDDEMALVTAMRDTIDATLDTLQNQDDWVSNFDVSSEFVIIQDTMETGDSVAVMPDFWSAADSAGYQGAAAGLTKANIADTVWSHAGRDVVIEDTLTTGDSVGVMPDFWSAADSTAYQGDVTDVADSVNAILDTLQVWDDDVALIAAVRDTADAILDTLQLWDDEMALITPMRDTINATVDTLQSQDGWVAKQVEIDSLGWRLGVKIGSKSYLESAAGADTVWVCHGSDTLSFMIFYHPGGATGDPPDTTEVEAP